MASLLQILPGGVQEYIVDLLHPRDLKQFMHSEAAQSLRDVQTCRDARTLEPA